MVEWTTAAVTASATSIVQFAFWFLFRRWIERMDAENGMRDARIKDLEEKRVATIERDLKAEGEKRKIIYERLEDIRLNWMSDKKCREKHAAIAAQSENYMAAVLKLERVSTEVSRLVSWVDDVSKEQISLGKDLAGLTSKVQTLSENQV